MAKGEYLERLANSNPPPIITGWKGLAKLLQVHPETPRRRWEPAGLPVHRIPGIRNVFFILPEIIDFLQIYERMVSDTRRAAAIDLESRERDPETGQLLPVSTECLKLNDE